MDLFPAVPPEQRSWPRRVLNRLEVNRAVFYALALRGWQFLGGTVSVLLITLYFTQELQGYYYTISGLVALQLFFELGMTTVIVVVASHEWARLGLNHRGEPQGAVDSLSRLASLTRLVASGYAVVCLLFVLVVGTVGVVFFARSGTAGVAWISPWLSVVALTGVLLWLMPLASILEGCEQIAVVNRYRLIEAIGANLAVWIAIASGAGLWALVAATGARLVCQAYLVTFRYRPFFLGLLDAPLGARIDWRKEVWPMQWRLAISSMAGYFGFAFFTPVIFDYHGPAEAGRMGMTWTLVTVLHSAAIAWVQARAPLFGALISRGDYGELDRVYRRVFRVSFVLLAMACALFLALVAALNYLDFWLADRLLSPLPTALFLIAILLNHIPASQNFYMRAHRREVALVRNVISSLGIGALVWLLGGFFGSTGAAAAYLAVTVLFTLPYQAYLYRRFHEETAPDREAARRESEPVANQCPTSP